MKTIVNKKVKNYVNQGFWNMRPRQKLPKVYIRNGCIYLIKRDTFIKEKSMIGNLENAVVNLTEGASDEKRSAINYIEYLADCLKKGKVEVKWNIS